VEVVEEKVEVVSVVEERVEVVSMVVTTEVGVDTKQWGRGGVMVELEVVVTQVKMGRDIYYSQPMS
jgi:hypothetical protein